MTDDQAYLWAQIAAFEIGGTGAQQSFTNRLMKENGWDASFAARAIEEYCRFAFLSVAAGHPISPSDAVDQVWHLHLLFTRNYWDDFCGKVLGRPLHHEPNVGAAGETKKFEDWYAKTRASYEKFFGDPPADLWPRGMAKLAADAPYRRVDLSRHWLLPRATALRIAQAVAAVALLGAMVLLLAGCESPSGTREYNPLDIKGPDFLLFYPLAFAAAVVLVVILRTQAKESEPADPRAEERAADLDTFEIAFLAGGQRRVVETAMASLYHRGLVVTKIGMFRRAADIGLPARLDLHPVERVVLSEIGDGSTFTRLQRRLDFDSYGDKARHAGWLISPEKVRATRFVAFLILASVIGLGIAKIETGITRNRPVGYLMLECLVSLFVAFYVIAVPFWRTSRGSAALQRFSGRQRWESEGVEERAEDIAMLAALSGVTALAGAEWSDLRSALRPPSSGGGSGSGCSSGGSCGGGGCGGGGCGGCGG